MSVDNEIVNIRLLNNEREENQDQIHSVVTENTLQGEASSLLRSCHEEQFLDDTPKTAHRINQDTWIQTCALLITCINNAYILGFPEAIMVHLGWTAGVVCLIVANALSLDSNVIVAKLHQHGGKTHIRYRDLAGYIYGKKGYYTIWTLQYLNLFMSNIGFIILSGSAVKGLYTLFRDDNDLRLSYCNLIAGLACYIFAIMVPHLSALAAWLLLSAILTMTYAVAALAVSIRDGVKAPPRDYNIPGTMAAKIFLGIGAFSNCFVPFSTSIVPEIQATLKAPVTENMVRALAVQLTIGVLPIYSVVLVGYWAYGSSTSSYLLNNASGPVWAKALANIAVFLQTVVTSHICSSPFYEYFDTKYEVKGNAMAMGNLLFRMKMRGGYLMLCSVIAALLPFSGDFIGLIGSMCILPLTFVIPNHMYLVAKKNLNSAQKLWHWTNVIVFSLLSVAATVESVRLIVTDSKDYKLFGG